MVAQCEATAGRTCRPNPSGTVSGSGHGSEDEKVFTLKPTAGHPCGLGGIGTTQVSTQEQGRKFPHTVAGPRRTQTQRGSNRGRAPEDS